MDKPPRIAAAFSGASFSETFSQRPEYQVALSIRQGEPIRISDLLNTAAPEMRKGALILGPDVLIRHHRELEVQALLPELHLMNPVRRHLGIYGTTSI